MGLKYPLAILLACFLQSCFVVARNLDSSAEDDNLQMNADDIAQQKWNGGPSTWGLRGWNSIHESEARKRSIPSWMEQQTFPSFPIVEKKSWKEFQGGWGKRSKYHEDTDTEDIASERHAYPADSSRDDFFVHEKNKRDWSKFIDGWGKRSKWDNFKGSWGKREPTWTKLKGMWG